MPLPADTAAAPASCSGDQVHQLPPPEVLQLIAAQVADARARARLACLCRSWRDALAGPGPAWRDWRVNTADLSASAADRILESRLARWLRQRAPRMLRLQVTYKPRGGGAAPGSGFPAERRILRSCWVALAAADATACAPSVPRPPASLAPVWGKLRVLHLCQAPPAQNHVAELAAVQAAALRSLPALEDLELGRVEAFPEAVCGCTRLTRLCFNCPEEAVLLPAAVSQLTRLAVVDWAAVSLWVGPGFCHLSGLASVRLAQGVSHCASTNVQGEWPAAADLTTLTSLAFQGFLLTDARVPPELEALPSLQRLRMLGACHAPFTPDLQPDSDDSDTDMDDLPDPLPLWDLCEPAATGLTELVLADMEFCYFPEAVLLMTLLRVLDLGENEVMDVPAAIAGLRHLQELRLAGNWRRDTRRAELGLKLASEVSQLSALQLLDLSRCSLDGGGLAPLAHAPALRELRLVACDYTDEALVAFLALRTQLAAQRRSSVLVL